MRLTAIKIANFRGLRELDVPKIDGSLMFIGLNGAGKTSALMALQWALTGTCYDKLGKPKKLAELIGATDSKAKVTLTLEHEGTAYTLDCTASVKASQIVLTYGTEREVGADARRKLFNIAGFDMTHAHASAHPHAYVLSDDLYVRLSELGGGMDMNALAAHCGPDNWAWLQRWIKECAIKLDKLEDLRKLGQHAYEERTAINRDIKRFDLRLEELTAVAGVDTSKLGAMEAQLAILRTKRDELLKKQGLATTGRSKDDILRDLQAAEDALTAMPLPIDLGTFESKVENIDRERNTISQTIYSLDLQIKPAENELKAMAQTCCPTCKRPMDTTTDPAIIQAKQAQVDALTAEKAGLWDRSVTLLSELSEAREELRKARPQNEDIAFRRGKQTSRIQELRNETPAEPFDQEELTTLEGRIARGEQTVANVKLAVERESVMKSRAAAKHRSDMLTWAVEQFRDGGAQSALGANAQEQFVETVNARLKAHGYAIKLKQDGGNLVAELWRAGRTKGASIYDVSDGELLIVQTVIAEALGCGFAIVDRIGDLDDGNRSEWFKRIKGGMQYVFGATWVKSEAAVPAAISRALGCTVVWLERDTVEVAA